MKTTELLRRARKKQDMHINEIAAITGVGENFCYVVFTDSRGYNPMNEGVEKIANLLEVDEGDLRIAQLSDMIENKKAALQSYTAQKLHEIKELEEQLQAREVK